jgi:hypothetical protein
VYAKRPFAGPQAVLAYLSPYTHRVAIANSRLRHYGLLASQTKLVLARRLLNVPAPEVTAKSESVANEETAPFQCRTCHQPMIIMAITMPIYLPRAPPKCEQSQ